MRPGSSRSLPTHSTLGFWDFMILNQCPTGCLISNSTKTIYFLHFPHSIFLLLGPTTAPVSRGGDFVKEPPVTLATSVVFSSKIRIKNSNIQFLNRFPYLHGIDSIILVISVTYYTAIVIIGIISQVLLTQPNLCRAQEELTRNNLPAELANHIPKVLPGAPHSQTLPKGTAEQAT